MTDQPEPRGDQPPRILIVDDEPLNVDYLEQELECHGFVTETAANGLEALERVASAPPDLVLLDVMMPELDGISALRILKSDPETRLIPVVLMTALNSVEDRVRGIEAGADDFLTKPVDDRELLARIRTALTLKRAIDDTVGELSRTHAHLEKYGSREREVAILAVEWRLRDPSLPEATIAFLGRRHREAAESRVRAHAGVASESDANLLLAVFEGPTSRARSVAAVEAALAILDHFSGGTEAGQSELVASAAISIGRATVGSSRVEHAGTLRWIYAARGAPVDEASRLAREARDGEVVAAPDTAEVLGGGFTLVPTGAGAYRVLPPVTQPAEGGHSIPASGEYPAGLTAREVDVLRLVAVGLSDAEAAQHLFLSVRTVNAHLRSIYRKLGVRSRSAAGHFAEEHGLLE